MTPPGRAVALVALSAAGGILARRLQLVLPGSRVHGLAGRILSADASFADVGAHLRHLFAEGTPIVGCCAAGILIRALAPLLKDKSAEPPVVAVAEDGSAVVPLLGGHHGANGLARRIADALGIEPAITTAGELGLGLALEDPPPGWRIEDAKGVKTVAAALLAGEPVELHVEAGDAGWLTDAAVSFAGGSAAAAMPLSIRVSDRASATASLVLRPPSLALGVGCERDASPDELARLVETSLTAADLASASIACVASIELKADEPAVLELARHLGVPARFFTALELEAMTPRLVNPSEVVFRETGCHGVAEGAALAAAGAGAALLVEKTKSERCTMALARAAGDIQAGAVGRKRGELAIVGIGPGSEAWRSPEVAEALAAAEALVGYGLYLDLLGPMAAGRPHYRSALGAESERARQALDLAAAGSRVALVSSGDAGIYGLAALVFELLDQENRPEWNRIAVRVMPGISALQAAAARVGAPLGHDFAAVSLSDLMTPWPAIERRLAAAASGDFVLALYNPRSERRRHQLDRARDILLAHRAPDTPVVLARNLGRAGERVQTIRLADLNADAVDMLTLVIIGSSTTRRLERGRRGWVYTPRGYADKGSGGSNARIETPHPGPLSGVGFGRGEDHPSPTLPGGEGTGVRVVFPLPPGEGQGEGSS
ncbi:MAG: precorrin-3B C(17)-methyltransferase [Proteobacteria bacterium]|nr:precorrin-3B C(17)-methyltransferase [Pseudomonadota bacterium]